MESYTKVIVGLTFLVLLIGSYAFLSENLHSYLLTQRNDEKLIIPKDKLMKCCDYEDEEGLQRTCSVFQEYSCDRCSSLCA